MDNTLIHLLRHYSLILIHQIFLKKLFWPPSLSLINDQHTSAVVHKSSGGGGGIMSIGGGASKGGR